MKTEANMAVRSIRSEKYVEHLPGKDGSTVWARFEIQIQFPRSVHLRLAPKWYWDLPLAESSQEWPGLPLSRRSGTALDHQERFLVSIPSMWYCDTCKYTT